MPAEQERPSSAQDLNDMTKADLVAIINSQLSKWPESTFNPLKIRKDALKEAILANSFTIIEDIQLHGDSSAPVSPPPEHRVDEAHSELTPPPPECRILKLLIEDVQEQPVNKFIQEVAVRSAADLDMGQWLVNGNDLLKALQDLPAALGGAVKLAFEDPTDPGRKRYFCQISSTALLKDVITSPIQLQVPESSRLKIYVEHAEPATNTPALLLHELSCSDPEGPVSELWQSGPSSGRSPTKRSSHADLGEVNWLKSQLAGRPGYKESQRSQGRKLTNKDRVAFWEFAADFSTTAGKPVKKVAIEKALSMGTTQAKKMNKILEKYGESGECAPEVVERASAETVDGHVFSDFLIAWEKSHRG
ncbi:hypothetical protein GGX14DRAFT_409593 [Mycena pura]|uniref:Uncharacterized protein n=1 Tax=Mycena pura TaxID=153505 RepID=A0AAD6YU45_9AGAR|nr:hypothetical protein GGX14DRAFT_409593 [Mycena pura]